MTKPNAWVWSKEEDLDVAVVRGGAGGKASIGGWARMVCMASSARLALVRSGLAVHAP